MAIRSIPDNVQKGYVFLQSVSEVQFIDRGTSRVPFSEVAPALSTLRSTQETLVVPAHAGKIIALDL